MVGEKDESFASESYLQAKALWKGLPLRRRGLRKKQGDGVGSPFAGGRDPRSLSAVLAVATEDMGWTSELAAARVITDWAELVGETIAPHTRVLELRDGVLVVQCDSTVWATELRRMRADVLTRIVELYSEAGIEDLRFLAPGAPSWRHGSRVVKGRGPRDTYG